MYNTTTTATTITLSSQINNAAVKANEPSCDPNVFYGCLLFVHQPADMAKCHLWGILWD